MDRQLEPAVAGASTRRTFPPWPPRDRRPPDAGPGSLSPSDPHAPPWCPARPRWILQDFAGPLAGLIRRRRACRIVPRCARACRGTGPEPDARCLRPCTPASQHPPRESRPIAPYQIVPGRATRCPRVATPIAHSVAHSPAATCRSRRNPGFSAELGHVWDGSCRTRTVTGRSCRIVPRSARPRPCPPRGRGCGASGRARSCHAVLGHAGLCSDRLHTRVHTPRAAPPRAARPGARMLAIRRRRHPRDQHGRPPEREARGDQGPARRGAPRARGHRRRR